MNDGSVLQSIPEPVKLLLVAGAALVLVVAGGRMLFRMVARRFRALAAGRAESARVRALADAEERRLMLQRGQLPIGWCAADMLQLVCRHVLQLGGLLRVKTRAPGWKRPMEILSPQSWNCDRTTLDCELLVGDTVRARWLIQECGCGSYEAISIWAVSPVAWFVHGYRREVEGRDMVQRLNQVVSISVQDEPDEAVLDERVYDAGTVTARQTVQ